MELAQFSVRRVGQRLTAGIDGPLLALSIALVALGLATLFSASYEQPARVTAQVANLAVAFAAMWVIAPVLLQTPLRLVAPGYLRGPARPGGLAGGRPP